MELTGQNWIAGRASREGSMSFAAINPVTNEQLPPNYFEASPAEIDAAAKAASEAFVEFSSRSPEQIAAFLDAIADEITALGDELISRANAETALPVARLTGERARTTGQLKMFAELVREGSW